MADADVLDLLADVARDFASADPERTRRLRDAGGSIDRDMWAALAANGWLSILVAEEQGGAGLGIGAVAIVARRLGYAGFPEPFVAGGVLAPQLLGRARAEQIGAVSGGELLVGVGWQEDRGSLELDAVGASVVDGRLTGRVRFVHLAGADAYVIVAGDGDDLGAYWVRAGADGLTEVPERCADGTLSALLELDGVAGERMDGVDEDALADVIDHARVALSAELVGVMDRVLELTLQYLDERKQFGRPIGSFQALQHRAVDLWMQRELAAAALRSAVEVLDDPDTDRRSRAAAASSVKARVAHAAPMLGSEALQLHGAIGFTDEYDLGLYINRALTLAPRLGGAAEHRRRYAALTRIEGP